MLNLGSMCLCKSCLCSGTQQRWGMWVSMTEWCVSHLSTIKRAKLSYYNKFWKVEGKMARQFRIQLVNQILHVFHCTRQTVINRTLCSWPLFQMPLCQEGTGPELGSVSLHCTMFWFLLTPSCCWAAKTSQHLSVPQVAFLVAQWQLLHGWLRSLLRLTEVKLCRH